MRVTLDLHFLIVLYHALVVGNYPQVSQHVTACDEFCRQSASLLVNTFAPRLPLVGTGR